MMADRITVVDEEGRGGVKRALKGNKKEESQSMKRRRDVLG